MELALGPFVEVATEAAAGEPGEEGERRVRVAVVGRPNVGKSTLINALLGEQRLIAFDQPGTTRDAIEVEFEFDGHPYTLIDTAGLRRRGKVFEAIEKFSVVKTLQAIADANVVVLLLDASAEVSDQDAHIAGYVLESGRALVIAVNKWDGLDDYQRERIRREIDRKLHFLNWARVHRISALKHTGLSAVMRSVSEAHAAEGRAGAPQDAVRAPGWGKPSHHRGPWQCAEARTGQLLPLPRRLLSCRVRTHWHTVARRVPHRAQPVRRLKGFWSRPAFCFTLNRVAPSPSANP
jgi:small GTP-binding protein